MRYYICLLFSFCIIGTGYSQEDSTTFKAYLLRPYVETGVSFISNDILKTVYATNSMYNYGVGVRFGNPVEHKIFPFIQFSQSQYTSTKLNTLLVHVDSVLRIQERICGVYLSKRRSSKIFTFKMAYINSQITDELLGNNNMAHGMQLGCGMETNVFKYSRFYIYYSYDFLKLQKAAFRDYDIQKLTIGFNI